ncbi:MAG TPA: adenosylmethionine decarboxylase [Chitinolyticbacter sp.]|nr:adenosylmethionine decarboxylase [Chitinolyticbacter sp.]
MGRHLLADCHGIAPALLTDPAWLDAQLRRAAEAAGAHCLFGHFHPFGPGLGVTGVLLLAESHISIHTWPEHGYAAIDVFMCGDARPELAVTLLQAALAPERCEVRELSRG